MARLIDAEKLNFHCNYNGDCSGDVSHCKECDNYVLDYRDIQEYPTAYEADTVVAELEMKIDNAEFDEMLSRDEKDAYMDAYRRAIEIVKCGGVNA